MKTFVAAFFLSAVLINSAAAQNSDDCARLASLSDVFVERFESMKQTLDSNSYLQFGSVVNPEDSSLVYEIERSKQALSKAMEDFIENHNSMSDALRRCAG